MIKDIDVLFGEILSEEEIAVKKEKSFNLIKYKYIFLTITSLELPILSCTYFIENTNFNMAIYFLGLFFTVFLVIGLLALTIWVFTEDVDCEFLSKYRFVETCDNNSLFHNISQYKILVNKMKEILEVRPNLTSYEYNTLSNLAKSMKDQEKNAELLHKINKKISQET